MNFKITKVSLDKLVKRLQGFQNPIDRTTAEAMGSGIVGEMKDMISKGISPIEGNGRFERYKAAGASQKIKKSLKSLGKTASGNISVGLKTDLARTKRGYPYNQKKDHPDKKLTPVNLHLSGKFQEALVFKPISKKAGYVTEVGYYDDLSKKKEQGHREEAGGQPARPTIPDAIGGEQFAQRIQRIYMAEIRKRISYLTKK